MNGKSIIKQDINFLDKPLWFQNVRHDGLGFVWTDVEGYEYRSGYKLPDKVDSVILLYLLMKSQINEHSQQVMVTRHEVLKECGLPTRDNKYYKRVEDSLKRWKNVSIDFHGTFYDGKKYITIGFGIIDDYEINEATKAVEVTFNKKWLLKIKESNFFKYLNFEYYKALKRPLSRRLFEVLCKTFKGRDEWSIGLVKLGHKLTLSGRTVTTKEGEKQVMYASDVYVAVKPAINEINSLSKVEGVAEKLGIHPDDLFTVEHTITGQGQERVIHFKKIPVPIQSDAPQSSARQSINALFELVPLEHREKKTIQATITHHFKKHGTEYVKRNIEYANMNHKINYRSYLDNALKKDWSLANQEDGHMTPKIKALKVQAVECWGTTKGNCAGFRGPSTDTSPVCEYCPGKRKG